MSNYIEQLKLAIELLKEVAQKQSTLALKVSFSMNVFDLDQLPDEYRLIVIDFLKDNGFRLSKWSNAQYKDKPGGTWELYLAGNCEFHVFDDRMIGNE